MKSGKVFSLFFLSIGANQCFCALSQDKQEQIKCLIERARQLIATLETDTCLTMERLVTSFESHMMAVQDYKDQTSDIVTLLEKIIQKQITISYAELMKMQSFCEANNKYQGDGL